MRVIFEDRTFKDTKSSVKSQFSQVIDQSSNSSVKSQFNKVIAEASNSSVQ